MKRSTTALDWTTHYCKDGNPPQAETDQNPNWLDRF